MTSGTDDVLAGWGWDRDWQSSLDAVTAMPRVPGEAAGARPEDPPDGGPRPGRVVRHDGVAVTVATTDGLRSMGLRRGMAPAPVVGDWVAWHDQTLHAVLDRRRVLRRRDPRRGTEHVQVANLDLLVVVCGADRPVRPGRLQRFAALAADAEVPVAVVVTKIDLAEGPASRRALVEQAATAVPGAPVVATSARRGEGLEQVRALVQGTAVLVGESGAGKSSLLNALVGHDVAATAAVRAGDAKGRHTTTARTAVRLGRSGVVVDTPGVRAVGVSADGEAGSESFADLDELAGSCRFTDCGHGREPGCAVRAAVAAGTVTATRRDAWLALRREARGAAERAVRRARRRR